VKVWVYKGEIFDFSQVGQEKVEERTERPARPAKEMR
jgi:small subunit ribosomal protein S3